MVLDRITEKEILPKGPEDEAIPTKLARLDVHIKFLHDQNDAIIRQIAEADCDWHALIKRAKELHICEDAEYRIIEIPVYPKKRVDIEALKRLAPEKYSLIVQNIATRAEDKLKSEIARMMQFVSQADVKAVVREKGLLAQIIPEPKEPVGWETVVVRKELK